MHSPLRRRLLKPEPSKDVSFERAKNLDTIVSALAIPIVLTVAGYFIQKQLAEAGIKKDYVAIAAGILKDDPQHQEKELREWAVKVLDENSPIPFSRKAKQSLLYGKVWIPPWVGPPPSCLKAPGKRSVYPEYTKFVRDFEVLAKAEPAVPVAELINRAVKFTEVVMDQEAKAAETQINLECLQRWVKRMEDEDIETRRELGMPSSKELREQFAKERAASSATSSAASQPLR